MSNICELIQIKPNNWIKVPLQGFVSAAFDAPLDTAPISLSGPILQLQICRWSRSHPPGATSSQPPPSWESPFSNLISTDYLLLLHRGWGFRLLALQGLRGDLSALSPYLWCCTLCWPPSFFTWWQRSLTSSTPSSKSAGKIN